MTPEELSEIERLWKECGGFGYLGPLELIAALREAWAENDRLRGLAIWGTIEPIGPKFDAVKNLGVKLTSALRVIDAARETWGRYGSSCLGICSTRDDDPGNCTCGREWADKALGEALAAYDAEGGE